MKYILSFLLPIAILLSCNNTHNKYDIRKYYPAKMQDSLKLEIVKYLAQVPPLKEGESRFDEKFSKYYQSLHQDYSFVYFFVNDEGHHFFYMLRPARDPEVKFRGVAGIFKIDSMGKITTFKEVFNTPPYDEEYLKKIGWTLFTELATEGNVDIYLKHRDYIEWPDENSYYDEEKFQWVYSNQN